jgi:negative elongation factor A
LQWRAELEEILEVAQMDSEQWVSMLAELMKTYPSTGNLNLEIGEVEENKRIFTDLITDLRKLGASRAQFYLQPKINGDVFPQLKNRQTRGCCRLSVII